MKTLRLARNIAALFILGVALLASQTGVGLSQAANGKSCGYKPGHSCYIDSNNQCRESGCGRSPFGCPNSGCI